MELLVAKFGGSSLANAQQFRKVEAIIRADARRRFVVPSAPGKRSSDDIKVTDLLYACYNRASGGDFPTEEFELIKNRYREIIRELGLSVSLEAEFEAIEEHLRTAPDSDYIASRGEYLNGILLADLLGYTFIDAAEVIFFDQRGRYDDVRTNKVLSARLKTLENAVIPGFYGSDYKGQVKTFSRGGSDITGSIVARAADADLYENFTDVSGFLMADPRIVENPKVIRTITYHELRELSYMGATVLHEDAIFPVRQSGIPINIKNTNDPSAPGTMIVPAAPADEGSVITGVAGHKGFSFITIEKEMMNNELGFGRRVLQVLEDNGISFEHLPSSIDTMSVVVSEQSLAGKKQILLDELCAAVNPDHINLEDGFALIAVVGRGMKSKHGTASRIFDALAKNEINIHLIDQGSSEMNIIVGVKDSDFENALRVIYNAFL
ncbi:MAG: aspartate kinase [Clostridia bacterium]|nr:aspartate kinase [Clostridia bacterium]